MTDKFKDQDSMLPAATDDKKKTIVAKTGGKTQVIINPPEKVDPQRGYQERFKHALEKHSVIIEKKTELVLQSKAARAEIPQYTLEQVFKRGYKALPLNSQLTREQYAMNRVNSFVAGGAAMVEDCDLLPIVERVGIKGTGGGARPHIKREKSPYNNRTVFHVVDAKGNIKHSTSDEFEAKKHLATKYNSYMGESAPVALLRHRAGAGMKDEYASLRRHVPDGKKEVKEGTLSPLKRFEGTKNLVKTYRDDTPGEGKKDVAEGYGDGREYGGAYVKGRSDDARMTERITRQAKAAAKKAGKTFNTSAEYRLWHMKQKEKQGVAESATLAAAVIGAAALARATQKIKDWKAKKAAEKTVKEEAKKGLYYYVNKRKKAGTSRDKDDPKAPSAQDWKNAAKTAKEEVDLSELSNDVLARYKAKAGEQASAADKAGDFKKGNKRFSGIMKATIKQFDNDAKGNK